MACSSSPAAWRWLCIAIVAWWTPPEPLQHKNVPRGRLAEVLADAGLLRLDVGVFVLHAVQLAMWVAIPALLVQAGLAKDAALACLPAGRAGLVRRDGRHAVPAGAARLPARRVPGRRGLVALVQVGLLLVGRPARRRRAGRAAVRLLLRFQRAGGHPAQHGVAHRAAPCARRRAGRVQHAAIPGFFRRRGGRRLADQERWSTGAVRRLRRADAGLAGRGMAHAGAPAREIRPKKCWPTKPRRHSIDRRLTQSVEEHPMASVNKVILVGNCGRDPEVRYLPSGQAVANVSIATTSKRKDKTSGETVEETQWHRVTFFDRLAEIVGEYVKKGRPDLRRRPAEYGKYTDKDGVEQNATDIIATEMQLLGGREGMGAPAGGGDDEGGGQRRAAPPASRPAPPAAGSAGREALDRLRRHGRRYSVLKQTVIPDLIRIHRRHGLRVKPAMDNHYVHPEEPAAARWKDCPRTATRSPCAAVMRISSRCTSKPNSPLRPAATLSDAPRIRPSMLRLRLR